MLPLKNVAEGTMEVGLWDKDVAGWNDCLGTNTENLYDHMVKAYRHNELVSVFRKADPKLPEKPAAEGGGGCCGCFSACFGGNQPGEEAGAARARRGPA